MQISNTRRIVVEDFDKKDRELVQKIATIYNQFAEEVTELTQGNIGIDNLNRSIVKVDLMVDAAGKANVAQINTLTNGYSGHRIIDVQNLSDSTVPVVSAPWLVCSYNGAGAVKVNKFIGLVAGKKLRVVIEFIP